MLSQIKASEMTRLRSELEEILALVTENVDILNRSILNQQNNESKSSTAFIVEEEAEKLLRAYQTHMNITHHSPVASVRLGDALKKYTGEFLSKKINALANSKVASMSAHSSFIASLHTADDADVILIDKLRLGHIRSYSKSVKLMDHCQELRHQRNELVANVNSTSAVSLAQIEGLKAKRKYLESCLNSLKCREVILQSLKVQMRDAIKSSAEFEILFIEKKTKLKSLNSYLDNLWKNLSSSKTMTLESYKDALNSLSLLSKLINELWSHNDGKTINLASSAAVNICQCSHTTCLSVRTSPPLYQEICKRLNSAPFVAPISKILDRMNSIVADCKNIDLINDELGRSMDALKELRDNLQTSLGVIDFFNIQQIFDQF
ncbi:hypothetical protein Aperf_G00000008171 [Anoplocephala perfoliata]